MLYISRKSRLAWVLSSSVVLGACGGGRNGGSTPSPNTSAPLIAIQPSDQSVQVGATATYTVAATGTAPLTYQWQKGGAAISGATASTYTTPATAASDNGTLFTVAVSNAGGSVTSNPAKLNVSTAPPVAGTNVLTYKNDLMRTGQNLSESKLTPANVAAASFGLLRQLKVDGKVDAQPLYVSSLVIGGSSHHALIVATEHASVYAFDADSGSTLWQVSLLGKGETLSDSRGCPQVTPEVGITSTPVIDLQQGAHGTLYAVAMSKDGSSTYHQRLHALDLSTGAETTGSPTEIAATFPAAGGAVATFDPSQYEDRAALLLLNGTVYTSWTSHCDHAPYSGWVIGFSQSTLARTATLNVAPNSESGPAIWMSGGGPAADAAGNMYLLTANGAFETTLDANGFPNHQDYGNSFLKISTAGGSLKVADYFTMYNEVAESNADADLGSGGAMLLPDMTDARNTVRHLAVGAGKDGVIYVVDRDAMGKFNRVNNLQLYQEVDHGLTAGIYSTPAYFNGVVYYGDIDSTLKAFSVTSAKLVETPQSQSPSHFVYPGTAPSISANGSSGGIVWAHENSNPAVLHAYDATDLSHELYNSNQAPGNRDHFGIGNKFITPVVADGKVFVGTTNSVAVFGLLH